MAVGFGIKRVFVTALTDIKPTDKDGIGTLRFDGAAKYKWVQFNNTAAAAAGTIVYYVAADTNCTVVDTVLTARPAGVVVASNANQGTLGTPLYGWIQIEGVATLLNTPSGALAVGAALGPSTTAGTLVAGAVPTVAQSVDGSKTASLGFFY